MFKSVIEIEDGFGFCLSVANNDMLCSLLDSPVHGLNEYQNENIWLISLNYISMMYVRNIERRRGIG